MANNTAIRMAVIDMLECVRDTHNRHYNDSDIGATVMIGSMRAVECGTITVDDLVAAGHRLATEVCNPHAEFSDEQKEFALKVEQEFIKLGEHAKAKAKAC